MKSMKFFIFFFFAALGACLLSSCSKKVVLKGVEVVRSSVESTITTVTSGTVEAQQMAVLSFGNVGRVHKVYIKAGDRVVKGQLLAELENGDLKLILQEANR